MKNMIQNSSAILIAACSLTLVGCFDMGAASPDKPSLSPSLAGSEAIETYDQSGDGMLDKKEVETSPALLASFDFIDADGDGMLSEDEIAARVQAWLDGPITIFTEPATVYLDGKPLKDATVTMEPEPFLSHAIESNSSKTDQNGNASFSGSDATYPGLYMGLYKVRVSKMVNGKETINARYNTKTVLGREYCAIGEIGRAGFLPFELKSR